MREELAEHETIRRDSELKQRRRKPWFLRVIRLGMVAREADILVHVERDDIFESVYSQQIQKCPRVNDRWEHARKLSSLDQLDEGLCGKM